jgi:hypothetical protein
MYNGVKAQTMDERNDLRKEVPDSGRQQDKRDTSSTKLGGRTEGIIAFYVVRSLVGLKELS